MTEARCRCCERFLGQKETRCPQCGWKRPKSFGAPPKHHAVRYGETPEVLRRLPLERVGREQKWRER